MKTITVQDETWKNLILIKINKGLKNLDDVINLYLGAKDESFDSRIISDENKAHFEENEE